ncbi:2,4-dichlorophenol 6-monooxygenase [Cytospora mali]|uniref:2,4-dichlorophenol 6-monooxygenase n=1 Tax=Cytospora mali TaxID=578113 RepID=A0A194VUC0_CYTMA|nr:2,4-dichlorophenol 6-monooxygenase [Valsa mali]
MGDFNKTRAVHEAEIAIVGGGPVGMLTALHLSRFGTSCLLAERNVETTRWPKMDWTNPRSMELFRMMGVADEYRSLEGAVGPDFQMDSIFYYSCNPGSEPIVRWNLPSTNQIRAKIAAKNDGTQPAEPGQRCSQIVLEAWLKSKCLACPSIDGHFGWKYLSHTESPEGVESVYVDTEGQEHVVRSKYLVGADGGSSSVRKNAGITMLGAPIPVRLFLVHFRSKELAENRPFGRFWHMFSPAHGYVIDQEEGDIFTTHMGVDENQDIKAIDPREWVYRVLGGVGEPYRFKIDEIQVTSTWRINFAIAEKYISTGGRVVLGGDACHRNPPHGGYGMNTGVEDALHIAWRLSALAKGYGGPHLLQSYDSEQRPVMLRRLERCYEHFKVPAPFRQAFTDHGARMGADDDVGRGVRAAIKAHMEAIGSEVLDYGIELDSRYKSPIIYRTAADGFEPAWSNKSYTPSTFPGSRVPHVFLKNKKTSTLDTLGPQWTLVAFTGSDSEEDSHAVWVQAKTFVATAREQGVPVESVVLVDEDRARGIWGSDFVLVRADAHVAWRGARVPETKEGIRQILRVVTGWEVCEGYVQEEIKSDFELLQGEFPESGAIGVGEG